MSELQYVTVVTYGRTGSTAVQAALNSLPGVLVRGENYAAMRGLHDYVQSIAETADRHHAGKPTHPWFGSARLRPAEVVDSLPTSRNYFGLARMIPGTSGGGKRHSIDDNPVTVTFPRPVVIRQQSDSVFRDTYG